MGHPHYSSRADFDSQLGWSIVQCDSFTTDGLGVYFCGNLGRFMDWRDISVDTAMDCMNW